MREEVGDLSGRILPKGGADGAGCVKGLRRSLKVLRYADPVAPT